MALELLEEWLDLLLEGFSSPNGDAMDKSWPMGWYRDVTGYPVGGTIGMCSVTGLWDWNPWEQSQNLSQLFGGGAFQSGEFHCFSLIQWITHPAFN